MTRDKPSLVWQVAGRELPLPTWAAFILTTANRLVTTWNHRGIAGVVLYVLSEIGSAPAYRAWCRVVRGTLGIERVLAPVGDIELLVDLRDRGIAKGLLLFGTWEDHPARRYLAELAAISETTDSGRVIDIGANIGYYGIRTATATTDDTAVTAIEPSQDNYRQLRQNVAINGISDRMTTWNGAIGPRNGTATLQLSRSSNLHRIEHERVLDRRGGSERIELRTFDAFSRERGYDPEAIIGVRMDLEGYELEVFEGMTDLFAASGPLVLFVEVHNNIFSEAEAERVPQTLEAAGFDLVDVHRGTVSNSPFQITYNVTDWDELPAIESAYCLIAKKPAPPSDRR